MVTIKHLGLRIDEVRLEKIKYIAGYEGRSANQHILILIQKNIQEFERKWGAIQVKVTN